MEDVAYNDLRVPYISWWGCASWSRGEKVTRGKHEGTVSYALLIIMRSAEFNDVVMSLLNAEFIFLCNAPDMGFQGGEAFARASIDCEVYRR